MLGIAAYFRITRDPGTNWVLLFKSKTTRKLILSFAQIELGVVRRNSRVHRRRNIELRKWHLAYKTRSRAVVSSNKCTTGVHQLNI